MLVAAVALLFLFGSVGMLLAARLADPPTGPGFWRLIVLLILGGMGLGLGLRLSGLASHLPPVDARLAIAYGVCAVALIAFGVRTATFAGDASPGTRPLSVAAIAALAALLLDPVVFPPSGGGAEQGVYALGMLSVATALGSVLLAMVLAHWYLIEPRMPVAPLNRVLALFLGTEILKLVLLVAVVAIHWPEWSGGEGGLLRAFVLGDALFVAVRATLGVLAPLGLGWMTWKTVQIRSIQSATGILYAAIVFVLFGEVISLFLQLSTGRPF